MTEKKTGIACLFLLLAVAMAAGGGVAGERPPSLEFVPSTDIVPEVREKDRKEALTLFTNAIGGFGISSGSFDQPVDVAYDSDGSYYVLDTGNNRIQKFTERDHFDLEWGSSGSREGRFNDAYAISVDKEDYLYVVDTGNHRIQKFDSDGNLELVWGSLGSSPGRFKDPVDITFDGDGDVYVVDGGNDRIQKFNSSGEFIEEWGGFQRGREGDFTSLVSIAWADDRFGYLYLLGESGEGEGCVVQILKLQGSRKEVEDSWVVSYPEDDRAPCVPARIEIDNEDDYVYILDDENSVLRRFTKDGRYVDSIWEVEDPLQNPKGFVVRPGMREVWVADTGNNTIQRFTFR